MKKATAFLALVGLILISAAAIYLLKYHPDPAQFEPICNILKQQVEQKFHSPILIGLGIFYLAVLFVSIMSLFERKSSTSESRQKQSELPAKETETAKTPEKTEEQIKLEALTNELENNKHSLETKNSRITELETQVENLNSQLEKFSVSEEDKNHESELETELKETRRKLEELKKETESLKEALKKQQETVKKQSIEAEALTAKIKESEEKFAKETNENKKLSKNLKKVESELEIDHKKLITAESEIAQLNKKLEAAVANVKSGKNSIPPAAYQILYLFQKEGRLIDLLMEDISEFDDETLGGAIRPIHEGCRKLLCERLILKPVLDEEEGSEITLDEVDPESIKLSGNVPDAGPYKGELVHKGWRLEECHLPELVDGWSGNVVAPAEIEVL
jgi:predicted  nucleic acid-binding Zn-ribbon protein